MDSITSYDYSKYVAYKNTIKQDVLMSRFTDITKPIVVRLIINLGDDFLLAKLKTRITFLSEIESVIGDACGRTYSVMSSVNGNLNKFAKKAEPHPKVTIFYNFLYDKHFTDLSLEYETLLKYNKDHLFTALSTLNKTVNPHSRCFIPLTSRNLKINLLAYTDMTRLVVKFADTKNSNPIDDILISGDLKNLFEKSSWKDHISFRYKQHVYRGKYPISLYQAYHHDYEIDTYDFIKWFNEDYIEYFRNDFYHLMRHQYMEE